MEIKNTSYEIVKNDNDTIDLVYRERIDDKVMIHCKRFYDNDLIQIKKIIDELELEVKYYKNKKNIK